VREIKFRAWDKENKRMVYDFDQDIGYGVKVGDSIHDKVYSIGMFYKTLMQYTGLKDKNKKEIYEGDLIKVYNYYPPGPFTHVKKPTWEYSGIQTVQESRIYKGLINVHVMLLDGINQAMKYRGDCLEKYDVENAYKFEVIGNIYENPELLEKLNE